MKKKELKFEEVNKWSLKKPLYIEKSDDRYSKFSKQLKKNGFCDSETWCLSSVISAFILPRLRRFLEVNNGYPANLTPEKWDEILKEMIFSFESFLERDDIDMDHEMSIKEKRRIWNRADKGLKLFAKYFLHLWW